MKRMNPRLKWLLISLAGISALGWAAANTWMATEPAVQQKTTKVRNADILISVEGAGTLELETIPLGFEINGEIASILSAGTSVDQGDAIATLVNQKETLAYSEAELSMAALTSPASTAAMVVTKMELSADRNLALARLDEAKNGPDISYYAAQVSLTEARYWDAVAALRGVRRITPQMKMAVERALTDWENAKLDLDWAINFVPNETETLKSAADLIMIETAIQQADLTIAMTNGNLDPSTDGSLGSGDLANTWYDVRSTEQQLDRSIISAPFDGIVYPKVSIGEKAIAFQPVVSLVNPKTIIARFTIDETDLASLEIGDPFTATLSAYPSVTLYGEVAQIGAKVQANGTVEIIGKVNAPEGITVFSGMTVDVVVETEKVDNALVISSTAIITDELGKSYVNKIGLLGDIEKVYITTGISDLANTQILSGLEPGDVVSLSEPQE